MSTLLLRTDCPKTGGMTDLHALDSFRQIIELWGTSHGSRIALAAELPNVSATQVSKWFQRDNIPAEYWSGLLATERARDAGLTADLLTALAAREPAEARG
jgi:hypothetical protein